MELAPVVVDTPAPITTITPVVKWPLRNRIIAAAIAAVYFLVAFLQFVGTLNLQGLGFPPSAQAWVSAAVAFVQFVILYQTPLKADVRVQPGNQT